MDRRNFFFSFAAAAASGVVLISSAGKALAKDPVDVSEADLPAPNAVEAQRFEYDDRRGGRGRDWDRGDRGRRGPPEWSRGRPRPRRQICRVTRNRWGRTERVCTWR